VTIISMSSGRSFYQHSPERYAIQKQEFRRLVAELKQLALKKGYSKEQIALELRQSLSITGTRGTR
jgi:hypothetical protein